MGSNKPLVVPRGPTKSVIIHQLRALAVALKRTPTAKDIRDAYLQKKCPSLHAVRAGFGSVTAALKAARLPLRKNQEFTEQELIAQLQDMSKELGRPLFRRDLAKPAKEGTCAAKATFRRVFGTLNNAFVRAGVNSLNRVYTKDELAEQYKALAKKIGKPPTVLDLTDAARRSDCASYEHFKAVFGGIEQARRYAGLPHNAKARYTDEELLNRLAALAKKLGRCPNTPDINAACRKGQCPSMSTYTAHFGSYREALRKAGIRDTLPARSYTRGQLIQLLRRLAAKLGHRPTANDINAASMRGECASASVYHKVFGGIDAILSAAALGNWAAKPIPKNLEEYSRAQFLDISL